MSQLSTENAWGTFPGSFQLGLILSEIIPVPIPVMLMPISRRENGFLKKKKKKSELIQPVLLEIVAKWRFAFQI